MKPGVLARLTLCLCIALGSGRMFAEVAHGGLEVNDSAEPDQAQAESTGSLVDSGIGRVAGGDGENIESGAGNPGQSVTGDGNPTKPVAEGAGERVDEAGETVGKVGECTGRQFKKCR